MCITTVTSLIDYDELPKDRKLKIKEAMEAKRKELQKELKSLNTEISRINTSAVTVRLHEVKK